MVNEKVDSINNRALMSVWSHHTVRRHDLDVPRRRDVHVVESAAGLAVGLVGDTVGALVAGGGLLLDETLRLHRPQPRTVLKAADTHVAVLIYPGRLIYDERKGKAVAAAKVEHT